MVIKQRFHVSAAMFMAMALAITGAAHAQTPQQVPSDEACQVTVRVDDSLKFRPAMIEVPVQCQHFQVTLRHVGRLPRVASPRNWVLVSPGGADGVARTGGLAGPSNDYVDAADERVLASSRVIGRDEVAHVDVPVHSLEPGRTYTFLSTIPGFSPALRGTLTVSAKGPSR